MVFYRKYRPQKIKDLDSTSVKTAFRAIFSIKRGPVIRTIPHAFLFTGPKGLGKTSSARIIAKVVNCTTSEEKREEGFEPCETCDQCVSITNGSNIDVLEIDGASNRGIDEIRDLREKVNLAPSAAKKKVYIIDEVHMLTTEAFNALLKTIEEPPDHVIFIFCTTEPHKIPKTIESRCFHMLFEPATIDEIVHSLKRIVEGEKIDIDKADEDEILQLIAEKSEKGFRDAAKILEELVLLANGRQIKKILFESVHKTVSLDVSAAKLLSNLSSEQKNVKDALAIVNDVVNTGVDMKIFISLLLKWTHKMLLDKMGIEKSDTLLSKNYELEHIEQLSKIFNSAYQETKFAVIPQLPLELAIIQYCSSTTPTSHLKLQPLTSNFSPKSHDTMDTLLKKQKILAVQKVLGKEEAKEAKPAVQNHQPGYQMVPGHQQDDIHSQPDEKQSLFENIIYKVKPYNHTAAGVLRGSKIKQISEQEIIFETAYKFHKERLEEKKTYEIIEKVVREVTGKQLKVSVILKK